MGLFPVLQEVYSTRCVGGEENCLLFFPTRQSAWQALRALGRWFLGRVPVQLTGVDADTPLGEADWAVIDLVGIRLAACSPTLCFERHASETGDENVETEDGPTAATT